MTHSFTTVILLCCSANSITLDPHKTGFCPYPAGGLLYRNGNIRKFLAQTAAYVHHGQAVQVRRSALSHVAGIGGRTKFCASRAEFPQPESAFVCCAQKALKQIRIHNIWIWIQHFQKILNLRLRMPHFRQKKSIPLCFCFTYNYFKLLAR